jgi:hypothetical protein
MEKDSTQAMSKLIFAFVTLIIGVVLVGVIAGQANVNTAKTGVNAEVINISSARLANGNINTSTNFTVTNYPTSWKITDCPISVSNFSNSSLQYTVTTDYVVDGARGVISLLNTSSTVNGGNLTYATYTYCGDSYLNNAFGRTSVQLIAGFFALALLLTSVGLFYSVARDMNIV